MNVYIFSLEMSRWGEPDNHTYCCGVYSTLLAALDAGLDHCHHRAGKYEPLIKMHVLNSPFGSTTICRDKDSADFLFKEITKTEWKAKEEKKED